LRKRHVHDAGVKHQTGRPYIYNLNFSSCERTCGQNSRLRVI
jgi:hypothetical protein